MSCEPIKPQVTASRQCFSGWDVLSCLGGGLCLDGGWAGRCCCQLRNFDSSSRCCCGLFSCTGGAGLASGCDHPCGIGRSFPRFSGSGCGFTLFCGGGFSRLGGVKGRKPCCDC